MSNETENKEVEPTAQTTEQVETPIVEDKPKEKTFTKDELTEIVERRLLKDRLAINKRLGVDDIDTAINIVKAQKETEEKQKIQKGEFEEILKNKSQEWNKEKANLETQLRDIKINKSLLSSASKKQSNKSRPSCRIT